MVSDVSDPAGGDAGDLAFITVGPMSSGTRLLTKVLIAGGCTGDPGHEQRFDFAIPAPGDGPIVWRRSMPHGATPKMHSITTMFGELREAEWDPHVVVIYRDPTATELSSLERHGFVLDIDEARQWHQHSCSDLAHQLGQIPTNRQTVVTYESLVLHPHRAQQALWARLGLPGGTPVKVTDENGKRL